jgi:hypothetical protein
MAGQVTALLETTLPELADEAVDVLLLGAGFGVGVGSDHRVQPGVAQALDRIAVADSARVESNDVEHCADLVTEVGRRVRRVVDPGAPGSTGIHHEHADAAGPVRRSDLDDRELHRRTAWVVVVEGDDERCALIAGAAGAPVELLLVIGGQGLRGLGGLAGRDRLGVEVGLDGVVVDPRAARQRKSSGGDEGG